MTVSRFLAVIAALSILVGVGAGVSGATDDPTERRADEPAEPDDHAHEIDAATVEAELKEFWAEVERTGLAPIGQNADGTGPYGWVDYDKLTITDGKPHADLEVFDAKGRHIGWIVHGLPPVTIAEYEADPDGLRQAGVARMAEFEAAATPTHAD